MIGTTLKLGFDGTSVDRGLGGITSKFGRIGRQIGIGMARQVGSRMTDMLGRIVMAIPAALKETVDWGGGLTDIATQTGLAVSEVVLLEEKLRLAGVAGADTGRVISRLKDSLYEARQSGDNAPLNALHKLNFLASEFKDLNPDQAFEKIGKRIAELGSEFEGLEGIMADLFGAGRGYKLLMFFNDFEDNSKRAENNIKKFAESLNKSAPQMDTLSDSFGRFLIFRRQLASIALESLFRMPGGANSIDHIFDSFDPEKLRPMIEKLGSLLGRNLEVILNGDVGLGDIFTNLGRKLGEGFKESFKDTFDFSPKGILKGLNPFSKDTASNDRDPELKRQTNILEDIRSNGMTARFA